MKRREFVKSVIAVPALTAFAVDKNVFASLNPLNKAKISREFLEPTEGKLITLWQWMNGCVTREGITYDLEAFKKAGITGVQQFLVGGIESDVTDPNITILGDQWMELMEFAMAECKRIGLDFGTHNCPGWSASGTPGLAVDDSMMKLVWSRADVISGEPFNIPKPPAVDPRWNYYKDISVLAIRKDNEGALKLNEVVVVNDNVSEIKALIDKEGEWELLRFGYTTTGQMNLTAPVSGQGLEVDKFSRGAVDKFWALFPGRLIKTFESHSGNTFKRIELDSYEAASQTWTPNMLAEFRNRRGYDLLTWLPALADVTIESKDGTVRFKEDWQLTIDELIAENYYQHLAALTKKAGMEFWVEPYGTGKKNFNNMAVRGIGDVVMCEFWWGSTWGWDSILPVASNAHVNGKKIVAAEAFTGQPQFAWKVDLFDLKAVGDRAFCAGVNLFVLHASAHQPWPQFKPGMTMGWWGTQFGPAQTWWNHGAPEWIAYVKRCQTILQDGLFVADLCYLYIIEPSEVNIGVPVGYKADICSQKELGERFAVKGNRLVLPDGMEYRILVLPANCSIDLSVAKKLLSLVEKGAVVIGHGLVGVSGRDMKSDAEVKRISLELFGSPGDSQKYPRAIRSVGKGKVYTGYTSDEVLSSLKIAQDFRQLSGENKLLWIHRKTSTGHYYFISNQENTVCKASVRFRITGMQPEIWNPETGGQINAPVWKADHGGTTVDYKLKPSGSVFVVFRTTVNSSDNALATIRLNGEEADIHSMLWYNRSEVLGRLNVKGNYEIRTNRGTKSQIENNTIQQHQNLHDNWTVFFEKNLGAPESVHFDKLISWTDHGAEGIKYFSGTARYQRNFTLASLDINSKVFLDLGIVKHVATIFINGKKIETLWSPPFVLEVSAFCRTGSNILEVEVTNLWPNRMIGDETEPDDCNWGNERTFRYTNPPIKIGRNLLTVPDWVESKEKRPTKRITFSTLDFFNADSPLMPSGLLGPVELSVEKVWRL